MAKNSALKDFFKNTVKKNAEQQHVKIWLDTGMPQLNKAVSGSYRNGFPCGRIVEIFGWESSGKTYIATQAMIAAQKAGGVAIFMDHEKSFDSGLAEKCGLNVGTDGDWIYQQPETFEESIEYSSYIVKTLRDSKAIKPDAPIALVFDSLASMVPLQIFQKFEKKANGKATDKDNLNMNDNTALARCTSSHFPALAQWANKYNVCMIFLNQCRQDIGVVFGDNTKAPGGKAPAFYASVRIQLGKSQIKEGSERIGDVVTAKVIKNKVASPFKNASWSFYYDTDIGIDAIDSLVDHMMKIGYLKKNTSGKILIGEKTHSRKEVVEIFRQLDKAKIVDLLEKWHGDNAEFADAAMDGSKPEVEEDD
ncbi:recombinase RecA [Xenorhabdus hominickii]|uniref:Protein RecA n=1 Tax=Xenorhabdus hominickii TaxID=351679 RepID=A0A1V0M436_XENHO|nr:recombinase [Xenorhabdus hominickii]ARD69632.1 recombinase A [Xenorhabdus hominickii]PHM52346.1 recombinase A [Xenorhabdus hominickii]